MLQTGLDPTLYLLVLEYSENLLSSDLCKLFHLESGKLVFCIDILW